MTNGQIPTLADVETLRRALDDSRPGDNTDAND
jgi:hypothetical protein